MSAHTGIFCPLCLHPHCGLLHRDKQRPYYLCPSCDLAFVPPAYHPTPGAERGRYSLHDNSAVNPEYREYMSAVADEVCRIPVRASRVLDYGSGPARMLEKILCERGVSCDSYDPLYGTGEPRPGRHYTVIVLCEVIEHFRKPADDLRRVGSLLFDGGYVLVRTALRPGPGRFGSWHYISDPTHINFFSAAAMKTVAGILGRELLHTVRRNLAVFGPLRPDKVLTVNKAEK
jgi:hypothetical protein